ncbi:MAG: hypothetical protein AB7N54_12035 [Alphaproteobacteria bacterium]
MADYNSIQGSGYPLAFRTRRGSARPGVLGATAARDVFVTEARVLNLYQKEAVVSEGAGGSAWRMTTDEGKHIKGTDLAPFPLGFMNAAVHGDVANRLLSLAKARGIVVDGLSLFVQNPYHIEGSFVRGDGQGHAHPPTIEVSIDTQASSSAVEALVDAALRASPVIAMYRTALRNTFAIYVNGRRRPVTRMPNSDAPDAADPYLTYRVAPAPLAGSDELPDLIYKTGEIRQGELVDASSGAIRRIVRTISGRSRLLDPAGVTETDTWLELPGVSHFALKSDERVEGDQGPSGLALVSAAIVFCYMTQLSRYIEHQKFDIEGVRLVQFTPFELHGRAAVGSLAGAAGPVDTHLFLNGGAGDETHETLLHIAARTCYLHALLGSTLEPVVGISHNGKALRVARAAA